MLSSWHCLFYLWFCMKLTHNHTSTIYFELSRLPAIVEQGKIVVYRQYCLVCTAITYKTNSQHIWFPAITPPNSKVNWKIISLVSERKEDRFSPVICRNIWQYMIILHNVDWQYGIVDDNILRKNWRNKLLVYKNLGFLVTFGRKWFIYVNTRKSKETGIMLAL